MKKSAWAWAEPAAVFIFFSAFYIFFRSNDFFAVDGSFRCLEVFRDPQLFFRSNNHLLYTPDVLAWTRLAAAAGYKPGGPVEFLRLVELMNCLAGATTLAIFAAFVLAATDSWGIALLAAAGFGLTRSFLAQGTNSNEPMPGILWSFVGMALAAVSARRKSFWAAAGSGIFFGLAMATYRSMVLLAPAAAVLLLIGFEEGASRFALKKGRIARLAAAAISGLAAAAALHGWAYWVMGERSAAGMMNRFLATEGSEVYFGLRWERTLNLPVGLARNLFAAAPEYTTLRAFRAGPPGPIVLMIFLIAASIAFLIFCAMQIAGNWTALGARMQTGAIVACLGLACTFPPLLVWDPQYDKLWVQPLGCLIFLAAIAVKMAMRQERQRRLALWCFASIAAGGMCVTLYWAYEKHEHQPYEFEEARQAAALFDKNDFIVGDWRPVAMLYGYLWAEPGHFVSFPSEAGEHRGETIQRLQSKIEEAQKRAGHVYFFGILDVPREDWNVFFGAECRIPYAAMDEYRAHATVRARFPDNRGYDVLWELHIED